MTKTYCGRSGHSKVRSTSTPFKWTVSKRCVCILIFSAVDNAGVIGQRNGRFADDNVFVCIEFNTIVEDRIWPITSIDGFSVILDSNSRF